MVADGIRVLGEDMLRYRDKVIEYYYPDPLFTVPLETVTKYKADLNSLFQELYLDSSCFAGAVRSAV